MASLPTRCKKYSVGKEIGGAVYVHRKYEGYLPRIVKEASTYLPLDFDYTVVKYVEKEASVSFVCSPDFDVVDEPIVGDIVRVAADGSKKTFLRQSDPYIYHHKWLFVLDDYEGFDTRKSKTRSIRWLLLDGIDMKRIGRMSFWKTEVVPRIIQSESDWLSSMEVMEKLDISACELSHLRDSGKLKFAKLGNAFYYDIEGRSMNRG
jgi:hypothetical protein